MFAQHFLPALSKARSQAFEEQANGGGVTLTTSAWTLRYISPPPPHKDEMKPFLYSVVSPSEEDLLWNYLRGSWLEHNPFASSKEWSQKRRIGITSIYLDLLVGRSISPPQGFSRAAAEHFIKSELLTTRYAFLLDKLLVRPTLFLTTLLKLSIIGYGRFRFEENLHRP